MTWSLTTICAATGLSVMAAIAEAMQGSGCRVDAEPSRRIELPDGRAVSTDVKSMATSGGSMMAVGSLAYVFPHGAMSRSDAMMRDSIIGFVLDPKGVASVVRNPPGVTRAWFPRVAGARRGVFHVLFVTTKDDQTGLDPVSDTASIWYARYHNGRWTNPERVISTRGARLNPASTSMLIEREGQLSFVFPIATAQMHGLILARRLADRWRFDSLRTSADPGAVSAMYASDGSLVAAFTMSGREIDPAYADVLFTTRFRSSWSVPARVGGTGGRPVGIPSVLPVGPKVVTTWIDWTWGNASTSQLYWLSSGVDTTARQVAAGSSTYPYESLVLRNRYPVWIIRGEHYGTTLSVLIGSDSTVERLATFTVPFENPKASAVELGGDRMLVLTMKQGKTPDEPMVASFATVLQFRCPIPARRE
jgi:hypothetical protein